MTPTPSGSDATSRDTDDLARPPVLPARLADDVVLRLARPGDGRAMAAAYERNREHLAPWDPERPPEFFTAAWQEQNLAVQLADHAAGRFWPLLLVADDGDVVGRLNIANVVRGAFHSADLGYWVDGARTGQGLMTAAVGVAVTVARDELGLHRLAASTLLHNTASQAVLRHHGFVRYGLAERYLRIAGRWQDHLLFQRILHD
ncbi:GCN5-related N-acetyltransferase [Xylanimonas cellulosilytica DSM 15894]|uniref:GCN5-related N-acetyltransferase n=1 Tax=Xylanimonas cellulosilytica (strain DSM 15894 / JCM 12276 / CECT 5975 / KCTC 9989 / LMG 20990 / NBRC 107835 / XIL07) TaxID=446471 RepID=D1BUJ2_XYLCX|nr:GNAT family N-acetyltransferase [Xylanimonas cellulosilytica]ACZ29233.1 GCN5-related N-acetyltransferase [Xylanimonas cellulosilytica DSM 15894]